MPARSIRLCIVDDHEIFRTGLKTVLGRVKHFDIVAEAPNGNEFLQLLKDTEIDVVLMDIQMPVMNGIEATEEALKLKPSIKVIALTMFGEDDYIQSMLDAGAKGFLLKNASKETLERAIETVFNGGSYFSEELFDYFARQLTREKQPEPETIQLTRREREVLQLLCEGLSNKEIAEALCISERTVLGHKTNLMIKTNTKNSISLMAYAIKNKLVVI